MSELGRRLVHASGAVVPVAYLVDALSWPDVRLLLVGGAVVVLILEAFRLSGRVNWWVYDALTREYEQDNPAGYALYAVAWAATAWVFEPEVAVPAMLMLAIADPVSGLLSRGELGVKRGWVLLATFGVCLGIASLLAVPLLPAVCGAVAATLADGAKPVVWGYVVDDNLTIPLGAAVAMQIALAV